MNALCLLFSIVIFYYKTYEIFNRELRLNGNRLYVWKSLFGEPSLEEPILIAIQGIQIGPRKMFSRSLCTALLCAFEPFIYLYCPHFLYSSSISSLQL